MLSPVYTDNRVLLSYPAERSTIVLCFARLIQNMRINPDVIAGVATSGIPWAALVASALKKPMVYVRKKEKGHGLENLIEGRLEKGSSVVLIEDLVSTGGSAVSAVEAVRAADGVIDKCFAIFSYELESSVKRFDAAKCRLISLTNLGTMAKVASEMDKIGKEELDEVVRWSKDPEGWRR
jgi:orotate phosphoribosyltransferase